MEILIALLTLAAASAGLSSLLARELSPHLPPPVVSFLIRHGLAEEYRPEPFEDRVGTAIAALSHASSTVSDLQREIEDRLEKVTALQKRHELLQLNRDAIEAVAMELTGAVKQEGRRSLTLSIVTSALFFLAGVGVTLLAA